jgi:periplasmic divalent cation tolerance protein
MADATGTYSIVFITASSSDEAHLLAATLVEERLAACVSIIEKVRSTYTWQGRLEEADEYLLMCKTRSELFDSLDARVRSLHSYQVPEIIQVPVSGGSAAYLQWINDALRPEQGK